MNPILRAAANGLNRSRSEGQIRMEKQREVQKQKRRQEKEKRRVDALEREKKWMALEKASGKKDDGSTHEESAAEKFQKELCWCIQQLEMGLANMKPNPRQAQEVEKVLRTLKSPKAPIAKKRQVMRTTFGDYRSKMLEQEKKHAADSLKPFNACLACTKCGLSQDFLPRSSNITAFKKKLKCFTCSEKFPARLSVMANKTNMSAVSQSKLNQATFYRKSLSGSLFHQRSFSSPAGYTPSLSPTREEVVSVSNEPSAGGKEVLATDESIVSKSNSDDIPPSMDSNKMFELQMRTAADDSKKEISSEKCHSDKTKEVRQSSPIKGEVKNISYRTDEGCSAAVSEKDSPTHSVISSLSSDSFNPATTSSSSSHESLLALNHPASCFRFDFKIEEEDGEEGKAEVRKSPDDMNKENITTGSGEQETTPSSQDGVSPTIEDLSKETVETKKKKRNRRKKKKKEQENLKEKSENVEEKKQECAAEDVKEVDVKNSTDSQIKLSLGGGDFKFDFDAKVESS